MLLSKENAGMFETLLNLSIMEDEVKFSIHTPRKILLVISKLIEMGISMKDDKTEGNILSVVDTGTINQLKALANEMLAKSGLTAKNEK